MARATRSAEALGASVKGMRWISSMGERYHCQKRVAMPNPLTGSAAILAAGSALPTGPAGSQRSQRGTALQGDPALRLRREGVVTLSAALAEEGGVGDHRGVVSGVGEGDEAEGDAVAFGPGGQLAAEETVGGDSSGDGEEGEGMPCVEAVE